jgi:hypothetical protein
VALAGGAPGAAVAGDRGNGEEDTGYSSLLSPWPGNARGGGSSVWAAAGDGGWRRWCLVAWKVWWFDWACARRGGKPRWPFYRHGEVGSGEDF